jgi:hypothetical protein
MKKAKHGHTMGANYVLVGIVFIAENRTLLYALTLKQLNKQE